MRKKFGDIFSRLDTIHKRDRQTDGWTVRHLPAAKTVLTQCHVVNMARGILDKQETESTYKRHFFQLGRSY